MRSAVILMAACTGTSPTTIVEPEEDPIAVVVVGEQIQLAVGGQSHRADLDRVLAGEHPETFRWKLFTLAANELDQLASGVTIDLEVPGSARFEQVYTDVCNPAEQDFDPCLVYEALRAGATGVRGTFTLMLGERLEGTLDVYGEGLTNRFGGPLQWHAHGTIAGISAPVVP